MDQDVKPAPRKKASVPACRRCRFWAAARGTDDLGECRRRAPVPMSSFSAGHNLELIVKALYAIAESRSASGQQLPSDGWDSAVFPTTTYEQWCGEFEPS